MCYTKINGIEICQGKLLSRFPNLVYGFTTRYGGVSTGEFESMSLSPMRGDKIENVHKNEKILCSALGLDVELLTTTKQEHTDTIKVISKEEIGMGIKKAWGEGVDGIITLEKNVPLICYSADCVPILFYADDIKAVGAVHSGWRGTEKKIAHNALNALTNLGARAENIFTMIGPCIGKCCYEVSGDVLFNFSPSTYTKKENDKYMLDLGLANYKLISHFGVPEKNIELSGICTKCHNDKFFSHRGQNGKSGTLGGIVCMRG